MTDFEAKAREIFDTLGMWMNYDTIGGAHINADHIPFIAQALREAAQSGAEEMRERAAAGIALHDHRLADIIRALPLPMNKTPQDA